MHGRRLGMLASAVLVAACSPTAAPQVGATVPPSLPPIATRVRRPTPTPTPTPTAQPTAVAKTAPTKPRLPAIFRREPSDPKEAYRVLKARSDYMRGQAEMIPTRYVLVPGTKAYKHRRTADLEGVQAGHRYVGGRTRTSITVLTRGVDSAMLKVHDEDSGWKKIDANGQRLKTYEDMTTDYVVWLKRLPIGWRVDRIMLVR